MDDPNSIAAYFAVRFPTFTYFVNTLSCTIGRRPNAANAPDITPVHVDIDLGPMKSVSRLHARIEYDEDYDGFVICVLGRNGAWVNGDWVRSGSRVLLNAESNVQIASRSFQFIMAPRATQIRTESLQPEEPYVNDLGNTSPPPASPSSPTHAVTSRKPVKVHNNLATSDGDVSVTSRLVMENPSNPTRPTHSQTKASLNDRLRKALECHFLPSSVMPPALNAPPESSKKVRLPIRLATKLSGTPDAPLFKDQHIVLRQGELLLNPEVFADLSEDLLIRMGMLDTNDVLEILQSEVKRYLKEQYRATNSHGPGKGGQPRGRGRGYGRRHGSGGASRVAAIGSGEMSQHS